jgi:phosphoesterase RecJ-like protein
LAEIDAIAVALLARCRVGGRVLLTGPEGPDGDSIGACLALQRGLAVLGVAVDVAGDPGFRYRWMPGAAGMIHEDRVGAYAGVVVLDGDRGRLPKKVTEAFHGAQWTGIVDHHRSTDPSAYTWSYFDPVVESTCTMVRALLDAWGVPLDREIATCLYVGIIFDTGGFRHSNTTPATHRGAAELLEQGIAHSEIATKVLVERRPVGVRLLSRLLAGATWHGGGSVAIAVFSLPLRKELDATEPDAEGVVEVLLHTEGVEVAAIVTERNEKKVKLSFRSRGKVDVAALARRLSASGGGHAKAAGAVLLEPLASVMARLPGILEGELCGG